MKLLVAEDEDTIRRGVVKYITLHTDLFSRIYEASNGEEAIDKLLCYRPDMILLDIQMPLKNGIEVMQAARAAGLTPIIIILSGYDDFKYAQQALKFGAREYLLKPVRASDILKSLIEQAETYGTRKEKPAGEDSNEQSALVRAAVQYMTEHYMDDLSLGDVAQEVGVSGNYLSSLFSQQMDCGFVDYLNKIRIERACAYLNQNYLKNYEIAFRVGFHDEKYFSKVFKKIMGVSPREYKLSHSAEMK